MGGLCEEGEEEEEKFIRNAPDEPGTAESCIYYFLSCRKIVGSLFERTRKTLTTKKKKKMPISTPFIFRSSIYSANFLLFFPSLLSVFFFL